jgi:hypothetical protein
MHVASSYIERPADRPAGKEKKRTLWSGVLAGIGLAAFLSTNRICRRSTVKTALAFPRKRPLLAADCGAFGVFGGARLRTNCRELG